MDVDKKQILRKKFLDNGFDCYVLFTLSGKEIDLAEELNSKYDDIYCLVLKRMVHRSHHGKKWDEESILIKGYVFVYVAKDYDFRYIKSDNNPYKTLKKETEYGKLYGDDYRYGRWVLDQDGLIGVSKAIRINEKIKIVEGPLQHLEGYIVEYSRRNRNCCVEINFMNQKISTWLPFEWLDQSYKMD